MYLYIYIYADSVLCKFALIQGQDIIIHQPDDILEGMNEWCIKNHGQVQSIVWLVLYVTSLHVHSNIV